METIKNENKTVYALTKEEAADNIKAQNALINQFKAFISTELKNWNITQGYDEDSINIQYRDFKIYDTNISGTCSVNFNIWNLSKSAKLPVFSNAGIFVINYVIVD